MPICSYIVYPQLGKKGDVQNQLMKFKNCEVIAAKNREILILITETDSREEEKELQNKLQSLKFIESLALSFAHWGERL